MSKNIFIYSYGHITTAPSMLWLTLKHQPSGRDVAFPFEEGGGIFIQRFLISLCISSLFCTHKFSTSSFQNQDLSLQDLQRKMSHLQASLNHPKGDLARLQYKTAVIIRGLIGMLATMSTLSICSAHRI